MLTHPKSTVRVPRILMHLTLSHVTLLRREFHPLNFFSISLTMPSEFTLVSVHIYSYIIKKLSDANENDNKFDIKAMLKAKK